MVPQFRTVRSARFSRHVNNGKRMVDYCLENFGAVSITGMNQAYEALKVAGVLDSNQQNLCCQSREGGSVPEAPVHRHQKDQLENSEAAFSSE